MGERMTPEQKAAIRARLEKTKHKAGDIWLLGAAAEPSAAPMTYIADDVMELLAALDQCEFSNEKLRKLLNENGIVEV